MRSSKLTQHSEPPTPTNPLPHNTGMGTGVRPPHDDATGPLEFAQDVLSGLAAAGSAVYTDDVIMPWEADACGKVSHARAHCGM